jgi:hypothetical protein
VNQPKPPSPITRWVPGRVTVAWAVLGAAAGVALMFAPFVYEGEYSGSIGTTFTEVRVRVLGKVVLEKRYKELEEARDAVEWWRTRVAAGLAAVGGLIGTLVGRREQRRLRRSGVAARREGSLWLPVTAATFVLLAVGGIPGANDWTQLDQWRWRMWVREELRLGPWSWALLPYLSWGAYVRLATIAVAVGWAAHVAAGARGFSIGRRPDQADDYCENMVAGQGR